MSPGDHPLRLPHLRMPQTRRHLPGRCAERGPFVSRGALDLFPRSGGALSLGGLALEGEPALAAGMAQLGHRHDLDRVVEMAIAAKRQPVGLVVAGGHLDRCGAVVGGSAALSYQSPPPCASPCADPRRWTANRALLPRSGVGTAVGTSDFRSSGSRLFGATPRRGPGRPAVRSKARHEAGNGYGSHLPGSLEATSESRLLGGFSIRRTGSGGQVPLRVPPRPSRSSAAPTIFPGGRSPERRNSFLVRALKSRRPKP